jgi:hypothetical protein
MAFLRSILPLVGIGFALVVAAAWMGLLGYGLFELGVGTIGLPALGDSSQMSSPAAHQTSRHAGTSQRSDHEQIMEQVNGDSQVRVEPGKPSRGFATLPR